MTGETKRAYSDGTYEAVKELQEAMQTLNADREAFENWTGNDDDLVLLCASYQATRRRVGKAFQKVKAAEAWEERQRKKAEIAPPADG